MLADMAADTTHPFVPIDHLLPAFQTLTRMKRILHGWRGVSSAYLLTGPSGVGKTHLLEAHARQLTVRNARARGGRLTLCCSTKLAVREPSDTSSFHEWLLRSAASQLAELQQHESVAKVLRLLAGSACVNPARQTVDVQHLLAMAAGDSTGSTPPTELSPEVHAALTGAGTKNRLGLACAVLKEANIAVIVHIDDADCLFQGKHFTRVCAKRWCLQLKDLLSFKYPAVGVVLCTSFQRASQLFVDDGEPHDFPPRFTHHDLREIWSRPKFKVRHTPVGGPAWNCTSLMAFLLTHAGREVGSSFSLFRRHLDQQPSEVALRVARGLDELCLQSWKGDAGASSAEKLDAFLVHIMEQFGHTPQDLEHAVPELVDACQAPQTWPVSTEEAAVKLVSREHARMLRLVMDTFMEILPDDEQEQLAKDTLLTFRSGRYAVSSSLLEEFLDVYITRQAQQAAAAAGDSAAHQARALVCPAALHCDNTAMDAGWLSPHPRGLSLGSLQVYRQNMCGGVHPDIK